MHYILDEESLREFKAYVLDEHLEFPSEGKLTEQGTVFTLSNGEVFCVSNDYLNLVFQDTQSKLIFGKDPTPHVVAAEVVDQDLVLYKENLDGSIIKQVRPNYYWLVTNKNHSEVFQPLKGNLHYKWIKTFRDLDKYRKARETGYQYDTFIIYDPIEAALVYTGITFFKESKIHDVSVLSFDIESDGLVKHDKSIIYLISNTFRRKGKITRKLFTIKDYSTEAEMYTAWCDWVREMDPSVILGHNIYGYDFPYLAHCAAKAGVKLNLGRNGSELRFHDREAKFRKDSSQFYKYFQAKIFGRQVIDTFFLSLKYDFGRKYESYNLKQIIKQEGLEVKERQFYDASKIKDNYEIPDEWEKIKNYCIFDSDDSLALYDLMAPSFFYLTQSVPKSFEAINNSATGSQINSFLLRSYLQNGHSIPKKSPIAEYEGAISFGVPGLYKNVFKIDVKSEYPSIIRQYKVYDKKKDPDAHFLQMVNYFTIDRLKNKQKAKETKDRYYSDLEQSSKIFINSSYGMLGAQGLNFNSPKLAAFVTEKGRETVSNAIKWASGQDLTYWLSKIGKEESTEDDDNA